MIIIGGVLLVILVVVTVLIVEKKRKDHEKFTDTAYVLCADLNGVYVRLSYPFAMPGDFNIGPVFYTTLATKTGYNLCTDEETWIGMVGGNGTYRLKPTKLPHSPVNWVLMGHKAWVTQKEILVDTYENIMLC